MKQSTALETPVTVVARFSTQVMLMLMFAIVLMLTAFPMSALAEPITLESNDEIRVARDLDRKVDNLISKVKQCAAAGLAPAAECHCYYPSKLDSALSSYESMLERHPEWEDRTLLWWDEKRNYPSNLHLRGLRVRFAEPCGQLRDS